MKQLFDGRVVPVISGMALSVYAAIGALPTPANAQTTTWTACSNEWLTCSFSGTRQVRFGANGAYAVRTATSAIACNINVFGDPAIGKAKKCEYASTTVAATPSPSPAPAPAPAPTTAPGPGVFVDSVNGSNNNPGTFAKPWQTLSKLASAKVAAGAGVYLKCGSTFRETLNLTSANLQDGSIVAGYGACSTTNKAVISGADDFTGGWTKSGNIWSRRIPVGTPKITQLFVNGVRQRTAQWPNFGGIGSEYAIAGSNTPTNTSVLMANSSDRGALSGKDIVGATFIVRAEPYFVDTRTVSAYNSGSGQFNLSAATSSNMEAGDGYVLQNKLWMLDAKGEFFHDATNGVLYVYPDAAGPQSAINSYRVEGTVRAQALQVNNRARLTIKNIAAVKTKTYGLQLSDAPGAIVDSVIVSDNLNTGLRVIYNAAGTVIKNSTLAHNGYSGIDASSVSGVTVSNNDISDTGTFAYAGPSNRAINIGPSGVVNGNTIRRSAYIGIGYSGTGGSKITNNLIEDTCVRFSDGAGIYTYNGSNNTVNQSSLIQGNIIARSVANPEGAVGGGADGCSGIMLDDLTRSVTVRGNTVIGAQMGIYVHDSSYNLVESNKVWLSQRVALFINMDRTHADVSVNNVVRNNQFNVPIDYSGTFPQRPYFNTDYNPIWFWHVLSGANAIKSGSNSFSGNELLMLNGDSVAAAAIRGAGTSGVNSMTSSEWRQMNTGEGAPRLTSEFAAYTATYGGELVQNGDFLSGMSGWSSWFAAAANKGSISLTSVTGCLSTCALFSAGTIYDVFSSPSFSTNSGGLYRLKFHASFLTDGAMGIPGIVNSAGLSTATNLSTAASKTLNYDGFYSATSNSSQIRLSAAAGSKIAYDSISVKQITGYKLANPSDWAAYAYGSPTAAKTVDCSTLGWPSGCSVTDGNGTSIGLPTSLPAGTAKLFLRKDTALRVK